MHFYLIILKLNNHIEDTKVIEPLEIPNAKKKRMNRDICSGILFYFSVEKSLGIHPVDPDWGKEKGSNS